MKFMRFFILAIIIEFFAYIDCIHIVTNQKEEKSYVNSIKGNKNSKFSKICKKILTTYHFIGSQGMDIYKFCSNKYELLSINNWLVQKDYPFCLKNLNSFYCDYTIVERPPLNDENAFCLNELYFLG